MAISPHTTLTRRAALTGTAAGAAAIAAGALPANADDQDRAEWLELWQRWREQAPRAARANGIMEAAEHAAKAQHPNRDVRLLQVIQRVNWNGPYRTWEPTSVSVHHPKLNRGASDVETYYRKLASHDDAPPDLDQWREASLEDLQAWEAECRAIDQRHNVPALRAAWEAEMEREGAAIAAIAERPATSIVGIAVKLSLAAWLAELNEEELATAHQAALRLASLPEDMGYEWERERRLADQETVELRIGPFEDPDVAREAARCPEGFTPVVDNESNVLWFVNDHHLAEKMAAGRIKLVPAVAGLPEASS